MARFIFKLDGVLRQRKQIEQERQRDLALLRDQARQLEQELRTLNQAMQATAQQIRGNHLTGRLDLAFLAAHRRYSFAMQRKGQELVQKLAAMQPQLEICRLAAVEAGKRRKAIEKLKERRKEQWIVEQSRREQAALDEISNQMFFARQDISESDTGQLSAAEGAI